jgi:hypothetical protein
MDAFSGNPFAVLTFIVAPAILTNASSVMGLQTANRFTRAVERTRSLTGQLAGKDSTEDAETKLWLGQLEFAERRVLLLVRALTAFYVAMGSFAGASFASLLGAVLALRGGEVLLTVAQVVALVSGVSGIGGLLVGSGLLVWESRLSLLSLSAETQFARQCRARLRATGKQQRGGPKGSQPVVVSE